MRGNEPQDRSVIASLDVTTEDDLVDRFGVTHCIDPEPPRRGQAIYGADLSKPAYLCGCQPLIHRFRCAACRRAVGWCCGGHHPSATESDCCDTCVVTLWAAAKRMGISEALADALDHDASFREACFLVLRGLFGKAVDR